MPRRPRLVVGGIPWHVIQRGNNRSPCFYCEDDYRYFLQTLGEQAGKFECAVHAYVLMTNHVHLLVTPSQADGVSRMMKHLGQRYVQFVNRTYRRTGTLWEGRFRSCLVQEATYVLSCYRYIELNPVRAGMVEGPGDYAWSSHRANAQGRPDPLVKPHAVYTRLGRDEDMRRTAYRDLFAVHLSEKTIAGIREATNGNFALGNERFRAEVEQMLKRRARPGKRGRPRKQAIDEPLGVLE